jgi:hypothetical protein
VGSSEVGSTVYLNTDCAHSIFFSFCHQQLVHFSEEDLKNVVGNAEYFSRGLPLVLLRPPVKEWKTPELPG